VDGVLDSAIDLLKSKIQTKHANLQKQFDGEVELFGVAGELRQIFCNLLSNSLDAIAPGGTIRVSLSHRNDAHSEQRVVVSVADDGMGIKPDALPRIFEPFFTTKADVGTGLGLWITQQLVERHGGSISVQSATDGEHRGTTFSVVLPANTP
jgi:signal transduction histidine kinase